jgi:hypothetical protein
LAKAAPVANAKAALRTIAAESTRFLVVNIAVSRSPPDAIAKHIDPITTLKQIVRVVDYSRWALLQANWLIKPL